MEWLVSHHTWGGHTLRTFKLGPKEGTVWECWCGETSEPDEYLSQDFARHGHEFHQLAEDEPGGH